MSKSASARAEAFLQCQNCKKIIFSVDFEQNLRVCPYCSFHHRLPARVRIEWTFDPGSFDERDTDLRSQNPLDFPDYAQKLEIALAKNDSGDSVISGVATLDGLAVSVAVADFAFMGGSMGSVNGEKIARTLDRAAETGAPAIIFCASGGARMQEGIFSLMQMAKTTAAAQRCAKAGVPFIAVFTDPTMAGVLASYASIADVIIAEPKALVGFAGARVSKQAGVGKIPDDFQTAEFVFNHGMIDRIVPRKELKSTLATLVKALGEGKKVAEKPYIPSFDLGSPAADSEAPATTDDQRTRTYNAKSHKEWEKPLIDLEEGITKLKELERRESDEVRKASLTQKIDGFEAQYAHYLEAMYTNLGPWEKVLIARAEKRPYTLDYVSAIFQDFLELDGDRRFGRDAAIVGGVATLEGRPVMVIGHQKGRNIQERQYRNFGMAKPEGYRKAIRLFDMAERFRLPVITFVDTPAADPGVESESRGISEAIAASMLKMFELTVPTISIVIGEGGSGGAIGIATSNRVLMQEHAIYSVIPPEGCAAILWRAPERGADAATALKLTAQHAKSYGIIDEIVSEPHGAAHRDPIEAAVFVKSAILRRLQELTAMSPADLYRDRHLKFAAMGRFTELGVEG